MPDQTEAIKVKMRTIEYYKKVAETNPKWLGTQVHELLAHYAELEDRHEQCLAEALEADLAQALERESRLQFALTEAGLDIGEPWEVNQEAQETQAERAARLYPNAGPIDGP